MTEAFKFCPQCATALAFITQAEDGGDKMRLRCPACNYTHWNNPVPVLAAVIEYDGQILLARLPYFLPSVVYGWTSDGLLAVALDDNLIGLIDLDRGGVRLLGHNQGACTSVAWLTP